MNGEKDVSLGKFNAKMLSVLCPNLSSGIIEALEEIIDENTSLQSRVKVLEEALRKYLSGEKGNEERDLNLLMEALSQSNFRKFKGEQEKGK